MSADEFEQMKARLRRILRRCGWTINLYEKPSGWYANAVKRDPEGLRHQKYIAPLYQVGEIETAKIIAMLPDIA